MNIIKDRFKRPLMIPVRHAISKLAQDLKSARIRRRIPMQIMAERAGISRSTLAKLERGDDGISIGNYASVIFILGMVERFADFADIKYDYLGQALDEENMPKRIRTPKKSDR